LGRIWGVRNDYIVTKIALHLLWEGKDILVEDILTSNRVDVTLFVAGGLELACYRLQFVLNEMHRIVEFQTSLGALDADVTKFVEETVRRGGREKKVKNGSVVTVQNLTLHLLKYAVRGRDQVEEEKVGRLHGISIVCAKMREAVEDWENRQSVKMTVE